MQLPVVQEEDAGRYTCEASNEAGRDRVHYKLEVLGERGRAGRYWGGGFSSP